LKFKLPRTALAALAFLPGAVMAQGALPHPDHWLSYNAGAVTDYRYRGISQSRLKPALQAGVEYARTSGFYAGAWASTVRWIKDAGGDAPVELDLYGGHRFDFGDVRADLGVLRYQYARHELAVSPNTTEIYIAGTLGLLALKYSHAVTNLFGFANSRNSYYLDASASFDVGSGWSVTPHAGYQKVRNNDASSYTDYAITLGKELGNGLSASAALVGTDADGSLYATPAGRFNGRTGLVLGLKYSF
jgi:uncharacterized protein (TIGR02001 family)